ncbi:MAG: BadF/BadG/BcrA/BcrD ATPase family protein [Thermincola sp.]|jgi:benzoyl-CoA reductase subunit D|nr:BadF/BadG/BcrA/BcrD ATPase family protein [Thermincola sp.]MDT3704996.1 BadF/BadG/BcrA/BcrD ATPase family protein [Thermincola sp.]
MSITAGIDVGSSAIKVAIMENGSQILTKEVQRIRRRDTRIAVRSTFDQALKRLDMQQKDINYIAGTGESEIIDFKDGHFYGMTSHARGAKYMFPDTVTVADVGALHQRTIAIDKYAKVLRYQMTGQCASSSGQFMENITRYLGVRMDEVSEIALRATNPKRISTVCAVLGETDVINMVSNQIPIEDILMGIMESMAYRLCKLLRSLKAESPVTITGGMANTPAMMKAIYKILEEEGIQLKLQTNEDAIYAGAIGAAIWADVRLHKLAKQAVS